MKREEYYEELGVNISLEEELEQLKIAIKNKLLVKVQPPLEIYFSISRTKEELETVAAFLENLGWEITYIDCQMVTII